MNKEMQERGATGKSAYSSPDARGTLRSTAMDTAGSTSSKLKSSLDQTPHKLGQLLQEVNSVQPRSGDLRSSKSAASLEKGINLLIDTSKAKLLMKEMNQD